MFKASTQLPSLSTQRNHLLHQLHRVTSAEIISLVALAVSTVAVGAALAVILRVVVAETAERWLGHGPVA
jgi:hypothetical protein